MVGFSCAALKWKWILFDVYEGKVAIGGMSEKRGNRWLFEDARSKMSSIQPLHLQNYGYFRDPPPISPSFSSPFVSNFNKDSAPPPPPSSPSPSGSRISPAFLFIIVILAVLFFIAGLLHLLVRFLIKHRSSSASSQSNRYPEISSSDALQRQLQQLFHLHDSGLDQAFIDALPVFHYKDIVGVKEPSDCAVCLYDFSDMDKLRLLPMCSHAFHLSCIDTWLLSNSTCPLCRGTLFTPGFPIENPIFEFDSLREEGEFSSNGDYAFRPSQKIVENEEIVVDKGLFPVRLGKFKKLNVEEAVENREGETSSSRLDERRCFSMGSYQYVVSDSNLRVALNSDDKRPSNELELNNGGSALADMTGKKIGGVAKGESYSISKIWLWPNKGTSSGSADSQIGMPSSLNVELPWMSQTRGTRT